MGIHDLADILYDDVLLSDAPGEDTWLFDDEGEPPVELEPWYELGMDDQFYRVEG
jgi:hypothetical protein